MTLLHTYLNALAYVRATGAGVVETSYYPALAALLDGIGAELQPAVRCVGQLANLLGAGSPDFGLYSADQFPRKADLAAKPATGQKPGRGVVEVKGTAADVLATGQSAQVAKYLAEYGLVLITNYRDFVLFSRGPGGVPVFGERYTLAADEEGFWNAVGQNPAAFAARHEVGLGEFLRRALLHEAPLTRPQDVAFFLASYARHALRLLDEQADLPALGTIRAALEEALGVRFEGEKGEHFFRSTLVQTLFYGVFSAWVLWSREPHAAGSRFDWRLAAWSLRVPILRTIEEKRAEYWSQIFPGNFALTAVPQNRKGYTPPIVVSTLASHHLVERGANYFPLFVRDAAILDGQPGEPRPNLSPAALKYLASLPPDADAQPVPADSLFFHAVATFHAPEYCTENAGALRQDWPRIPLPADRDALLASAALGRRVAALLDPETPVPGITTGPVEPRLRRIATLTAVGDPHAALDPATDLAVTAGWGHFGQGNSVMPGRGKAVPFNDLDSGGLDEDTDGAPLRSGPDFYRVHLNARACWDFVPRAVWEYSLGGYPVLKKWLSYREEAVLGRALRPEEAREFTAVARRIAALLHLAPDLDASYQDCRMTVPDGG